MRNFFLEKKVGEKFCDQQLQNRVTSVLFFSIFAFLFELEHQCVMSRHSSITAGKFVNSRLSFSVDVCSSHLVVKRIGWRNNTTVEHFNQCSQKHLNMKMKQTLINSPKMVFFFIVHHKVHSDQVKCNKIKVQGIMLFFDITCSVFTRICDIYSNISPWRLFFNPSERGRLLERGLLKEGALYQSKYGRYNMHDKNK